MKGFTVPLYHADGLWNPGWGVQRPINAAGLTTCKCLKKKPNPSHSERSSSVNNPVSHPNAGEYSFWARCQEQCSQRVLNCCSHGTHWSQGRQRYEKSSKSGTQAHPCTCDTRRRLASSRLTTGEGAFKCCQAETTFWAARPASCNAGPRAAARGRTELREAPSHRRSSTVLAAPRAPKRALTAEPWGMAMGGTAPHRVEIAHHSFPSVSPSPRVSVPLHWSGPTLACPRQTLLLRPSGERAKLCDVTKMECKGTQDTGTGEKGL